MKTYLPFIYLIYLLLSTSCSSNTQKPIDHSEAFRAYYYNLNLAIDARNKNDKESHKKALWAAYKSFPKQQEVPLPYYVLAKALNAHDFEDTTALIALLKTERAVAGTKEVYLNELNATIRPFVEKYQEVIHINNFYHPKHLQLKAELDSIMALDQYARGGEAGDVNLIRKEHLAFSFEEADSFVFHKMRSLHKKYGYFGTHSCAACFTPVLTYVHLDDFDELLLINDYLLDLLHKGYLSPNEYAWIYDRSYFRKYGDMYYFYCMGTSLNEYKYSAIERFSQEQLDTVNARRASIGIPPIPFDFEMIRKGNL